MQGLNFVTAAIILWNKVYLDRAITSMKEHGQEVDELRTPINAIIGFSDLLKSFIKKVFK